MRGEHSVRRRGRFIAPVSWHYQIHIFALPNTCIHFDKCVYPNHHTRVFTSPHTHFRLSFRGCFRICGHDKSALRLLVVCHNAANGLLIMQRPPTKCVANIPPGVGADSSRPYPDIIKYTYPFHHTRILTSSNTHIRITEYVYTHYQMHIFTSPNTCIQIITYVFSHHHIRISVPHFVGVFIYAGTINRPLQLLTVCHYAADGLR